MSESEPISYQDWVGNFSAADPSLVVLSSQAQNWTGLEVVQIHHNANQAIALANSFPMAAAGLVDMEVIELAPYNGLERLFS
jgi:hypothetical protein